MKKSPHSIFLKICVNAVAVIMAIAIFRIVLHCNHGFHVWAIKYNMPDERISLENEEIPLSILQQKFYFLAKGKQAFAFESSCGKYVLKIPNNHYFRRRLFLSLLPDFSIKTEKINYNTAKLKKTFTSYWIAHHDLKENSAIIYAHLAPTSHIEQSLHLVDSLGREWNISADSLAFIVQKKAELVYPYLRKLRAQGFFEQAKHALGALLDYLEKRCLLGIADNDPLIRTNLGFIDGKPIQIDIGPFSYDRSIATPEAYQKELLRICTSLRDWLDVHFPEISDSFAQQLEIKTRIKE